jgi:chromosome segregation ATPase
MENNLSIIHDLAAEKMIRGRLEEELTKMQGLVILLEGQLKTKSQEVTHLKVKHETLVAETSEQIKILKNKNERLEQENEKFKSSLSELRNEFFKVTDSDIEKTSKIDELYVTITHFQEEVRLLRGQIGALQMEVSESYDENRRLVEKLSVKKESKFVQADPSPLTYMVGTPKSLKKSSSQLTNSLSLARTRSHIQTLQKEKQRLDKQIHLLSKFD